MADEKYNTYEKFLNAKIKEYKDAGLKHLIHSLNLKVRTIKGDGDYVDTVFAHYDWLNGAPKLRLGPQNAVVEIKSYYNFIKKIKLVCPTRKL